MNEELKPCPFCGGEAKAREEYPVFGIVDFKVYCTKCYITTQPDSLNGAIAVWNQRKDENNE